MSWYVEHYEHEFTAVEVGEPEIEENGSLLSTVRPEQLHFLLQLGEQGPGEIDYEITNSARDLVTGFPVVTLDFIRPTLHDFKLIRDDVTVMTGMLTMLNIEAGEQHIKVGGKDFLHYLERRLWPYDADLSYVNWPDGFRFKVAAAEIGQIVADVLETVRDVSPNFPGPPNDLTSPSYSLKYLVDCDNTGKTRNFEISAFETSSIYDLIQSLSQADKSDGGFDFYMTAEMPPAVTFKLVYPEIGDPDTPIFTLERNEDSMIADLFKLGYTDQGTLASHVLGLGSGTANRQGGYNRHLRIVSARTRRLDTAADFQNVKDLDTLADKTLAQLNHDWNPVREIPVVIDPKQKNPDGSDTFPNFWTVCKPGKYVMVDYDLKGHRINSVQKIVSMDCTVNQQGDEQVALGLNPHIDGGATSVVTDP